MKYQNFGYVAVDLSPLEDFANAATVEIAKFTVKFNLSPERLQSDEFGVDVLDWSHIPYGSNALEQVPNDKRGVYAFVACHENGILPPNKYVMYIGIAGRKSDRPLRDRYRDYLNVKSVIKRPKIARMIGTWHSVLQFYFAAVEDTIDSDTLEAIEEALNSALMPPFSQGDFDVELKKKRIAFQ